MMHRDRRYSREAEYIIAFGGLALFWILVIGDVLFNWLAYSGLPEWLTR